MEKYSYWDKQNFNKSRAQHDAELVDGGAILEFDGTASYKLIPTPEQIELLHNEMEADIELNQKKDLIEKTILKMYDQVIEDIKKRIESSIKKPWPGTPIPRINLPMRKRLGEEAFQLFRECVGDKIAQSKKLEEKIDALYVASGTPTMSAGEPVQRLDFAKQAYELVTQLSSAASPEALRRTEDTLRAAAIWALQYKHEDLKNIDWQYWARDVLNYIEKAVESNPAINIERVGMNELKAYILEYAGAVRLDYDWGGPDLNTIKPEVDYKDVLARLARTESAIFLTHSGFDIGLPKSGT